MGTETPCRVGIKLYNLAAVHTERDVQRDVAAVDAGARFNAVSRDFTFVAVFLLGRHPG